jgi:ribonuclease P protein subunit RPR2
MQKPPLRELVYERMGILLDLAARALGNGDLKHAKRYVFLARKLSTRYNCRMPPQLKSRFCKGCGLPLIPGRNAKVRLRKRTRRVEYLCACGHPTLLGYGKKQALRTSI